VKKKVKVLELDSEDVKVKKETKPKEKGRHIATERARR